MTPETREELARAMPSNAPIGDHRNGNRLDNTRDNLRWATCQMNALNIHGFVTLQGCFLDQMLPADALASSFAT